MQKMHIYLSLQSTKCIADWFSLKGNILSFLPCPLTLCEYPTTADSATAGHWFCHRSHNHDHLHTKVKGLNIQLWVKLIISNCHSYTLVQNCLGTTFKLIINTKTLIMCIPSIQDLTLNVATLFLPPYETLGVPALTASTFPSLVANDSGLYWCGQHNTCAGYAQVCSL